MRLALDRIEHVIRYLDDTLFVADDSKQSGERLFCSAHCNRRVITQFGLVINTRQDRRPNTAARLPRHPAGLRRADHWPARQERLTELRALLIPGGRQDRQHSDCPSLHSLIGKLAIRRHRPAWRSAVHAPHARPPAGLRLNASVNSTRPSHAFDDITLQWQRPS